MKKGKKIIVYIIIWIIFVVTLIFSNKIIILLKGNNLIKTFNNIENYKKNAVYYAIDVIDIKNDIFDSFNFRGWAYCETQKENKAKSVFLILTNESNTYSKELNLTNRGDISLAFGENQKVKGDLHGVNGKFSTIDVENGIYSIYIYCKENDENYGLVDTGLMLKKDGKGISKYTWQSTLSRISSPVEDLQAKSSLDSANITAEGYLQIVGWSFVDGFDTTNQSVYIRLSNEDGTTATYNTQSVSRPDVGKAYKNDIYNESGFKAVIPIDMLPAGDIKIEILVENDGNIYKAQKLYIYSPDP